MLRFPRFISVGGRIFLRIQVDGEDLEIEISRDQAWNLMLDLLPFMALQERTTRK